MVSQHLSKIISFLRFPLIVAVIFIHCNLTSVLSASHNNTVFSVLMHVTLSIVFQAVPIFFLISGYLFFKEQSFCLVLYFQKLKKRFSTLLIPYVCWNIVYFIVIAFLQSINPYFLLILHKRIADFSFTDYFWIFWDISKITGMPDDQSACIVGAFWFLQCLFVMCVISPLIYLLMKLFRHLFPLLLLIVYFSNIVPTMPGVHPQAIFYFSLGSFLSFYGIDFLYYIKKYIPLLTVMFVVLLFILYFNDNIQLYRLYELMMIVVFFYIVNYLVIEKKWQIGNSLVSCVFFVFGIHRLFTAAIMRLSTTTVPYISNDILLYVYYVLCVTLSVILSVYSYRLLKLIMPHTAIILNGGKSV